ncbi:acetoin utilization AcuB family protein [Cytobacillus gottheilii]|uniref:Acetoin utilization AcuB family protein n=1 Tax=Cytobacillus gottheilii TaxID=859144 RepID=A0ABX8F9B3_9BACI|nr:acetoin utilization AcuB family protein [Cytobacillus gottheilii]QVY60705.1 acetoin utilization AcuB family protein [Cytobacillus gottheilii]
MLVEEIMKQDVTTLTKEHSIGDAVKIMSANKIRHLPIIDEQGQLIGLVTDRDIRDATPSIFETDQFMNTLQKPLHLLMQKDIITGHPLDLVAEVSALLYEHRISCLPIVKNHKLVGIVTETDLLHTLVELTGAHQPGSHIEVRVENKSGKLYEVTSIIRERKANIQSVLVYPDKKNDQFKIIVIRVQTMNPLSIIKDLTSAGYEVLWPNHSGKPL